ncbi:antibiotic biosynthesis monooxygenase family protein [Microvirga sp. Mcv34]|uniref:antibiotic biosynthesis monooxygenase family protein n=1 Tax=Microvirga sp. Mcv34 TaxID=2926016 RepID=UPI0021C777A9|nr:antibiotic biosynthesis monooxygenase family protein [Microvirga sp. Mcv34]
MSETEQGVVLINIFTVSAADQDRLVSLLTKATDGIVDRAPGFLSATLHRSVDGTKVAMYSRWRSISDYDAMRDNPAPMPFLQEALTFATFEPGIYNIERTFVTALV